MIELGLKTLIDDYLKQVEIGLKLFKEKIGDIHPLRAWGDKLIPQNGKLSQNVEYEFHGIGCYLTFSDHEINFDFGPENRHDGFDLWRLGQYIESCPEKYPEYQDKEKLKIDFEHAIEDGAIAKLDHPHCNLYYFTSAIDKRIIH